MLKLKKNMSQESCSRWQSHVGRDSTIYCGNKKEEMKMLVQRVCRSDRKIRKN